MHRVDDVTEIGLFPYVHLFGLIAKARRRIVEKSVTLATFTTAQKRSRPVRFSKFNLARPSRVRKIFAIASRVQSLQQFDCYASFLRRVEAADFKNAPFIPVQADSVVPIEIPNIKRI
jgi:hypothetical protein